ncbi:alpha-hydroxy acid oxidase [Modestobacter sp. Leaf380]|uniref:alpha-hydroxy acid oxidase n=1 Tax=Modestobacter sp. Leaf380 TaxID=1736356 RepID=UPI0006F1D45E|nr:alpha-hydroxy acid oxidase [Modestobacter sp. Leaf380]KQS68811.1 alpha-hydroxy-acid oxidizing enzyme [Modestobacter sp. Leaf380]
MLTLLREQADAARTRLDPAVHDYYASGSGAEVTAGEAQAAWSAYRLRPRVLHDVSTVDLSVQLPGARVESPFVVAPMAFHALAHPEGERATFAGTGAAGCLGVLSTRSSVAVEDVAAVATAPWWFQAYGMRDRSLTHALVRRAAAAGATAVVLTVDTPYVGRKGKVSGVRISVPDDQYLVNLAQHLVAGTDGRALAEQDPSMTPDVIAELTEVSGLPVLVKGVLRGDEARRCVDAGAAGVVVSNHGGRQLDRALPSALALPDVVAAVGDDVPVLVDGGIRTGLDALTALALGADAVLVGRPVLWALSAGGAEGVAACLDALHSDLAHVLAVAGAASLADLDASMAVSVTGR